MLETVFALCTVPRRENGWGGTFGFSSETHLTVCVPVTPVNLTDFSNHLVCVKHYGGPSDLSYR